MDLKYLGTYRATYPPSLLPSYLTHEKGNSRILKTTGVKPRARTIS